MLLLPHHGLTWANHVCVTAAQNSSTRALTGVSLGHRKAVVMDVERRQVLIRLCQQQIPWSRLKRHSRAASRLLPRWDRKQWSVFKHETRRMSSTI
jgi:hypothetical protein